MKRVTIVCNVFKVSLSCMVATFIRIETQKFRQDPADRPDDQMAVLHVDQGHMIERLLLKLDGSCWCQIYVDYQSTCSESVHLELTEKFYFCMYSSWNGDTQSSLHLTVIYVDLHQCTLVFLVHMTWDTHCFQVISVWMRSIERCQQHIVNLTFHSHHKNNQIDSMLFFIK